MPNELVRVPLATNLLSRGGTSAKDALIQNGLINAADQEIFVEKRPGFTERYADPATETGLGVYAFDSEPFAVFGDDVFRGLSGSLSIVETGIIPVGTEVLGTVGQGLVNINGDDNLRYYLRIPGEPANLDNHVSFSTGNGSTGTWSSGYTTVTGLSTPERSLYGLGVFLNRTVMVGGVGDSGKINDVSSSVNGIAFVEHSTPPFSTRIRPGVTTLSGTFYVAGSSDNVPRDVWSTTDLESWVNVGTAGTLPVGIGVSFGTDGTDLFYTISSGTIGIVTFSIYKSTDGGASFSLFSSFLHSLDVFDVPGDGNMFLTEDGSFAMCIGGLSDVFVSTDNGLTWTTVDIADGPAPTGLQQSGTGAPLNNNGFIVPMLGVAGVEEDTVAKITGVAPPSLVIPDFVDQQMYFVGTDCGAATLGFLFKNATRAWFYNTTLNTITQVTDADYPALTVPGAVLLNGRFYVMTDKARIHNSALNDPFTWSALDVIGAIQDTDCGVALTRYRNYIVAFKEFTTEFFFDTGASPGSPIRRVDSAFTEIGCGDGNSVVSFENTVIFIGQSKRVRGTSVYMLDGYTPKKISNEFVERIIESDNLSATRAFAFDFHGKSHYLVQLNGGADTTIVYNMDDGVWYRWTSRTAGTAQSVTSITFANNGVNDIAAVTLAGHGFKDGDLMTIAGAVETEYNGTFQIQNVSVNTFDYILVSTPSGPATGTITAIGFTEGPYRPVGFMASGGLSLLQDGLNGKLYSIVDSSLTDDGVYIDYLVRTALMDFGNTMTKFIRRVEPIGDKTEVASNLLIRHTDDDYQTFSPYRKVDLNRERPQLKRLGSTRRRGYEVRHTDTPRIRLSALEVEADVQGIT